MASRKEEKDAVRRARLAAEQAAVARAAQRRRLGAVGGVVIIAVIVAVVVVAISSSGQVTGGIQTGTRATVTEDAVTAELRGIPQDGTTLGRAGAPVTIEYFGDLECPYCAELTRGEGGGGLPQLIDGPVRQGEVKLVYRSAETATGGANNDRWIPQQVAAYAAGQQGLFWDYAELFYHEQGDESTHYVTESYLRGLARQIPRLRFRTWMSARGDAALAQQVTAEGRRAVALGVTGTPTLIATGAHGSETVQSNASGVQSLSAIMSAVKAVS